MTRIALISSADARYYPMLREWIESVRRFPQSRDMDICILDVGLTPAQIETLRPLVTGIERAAWPKKISARRIRGREYYKACINRPFLRDYFPNYEVYVWMDADTWVQDWEAVELFIRGAQRGKLAVAPQTDRGYPRTVRVKWIGHWPWKVRSFYFTNARLAFGFETARALLPRHVLQAGVFALRGDAPHWERWQDLILKALDKGKVFTAEQLTMGMMVHLDGYPAEILPAWCHWLCEFKPLWDEESKRFVEPFLPHKEIGILHLAGCDDMRMNRSVTTDFETLADLTQDRKTLALSYRYPFYDGETESMARTSENHEKHSGNSCAA
ncbi:MAG: hypothetical protein H6862_04685 [Rhodospirillales bacterium]|nr:hypothetical protein [Rhodospirillales bacterium]